MSRQVNDLYEFGPFRIDSRERLLSCHGKAVAITPKAFDTLLVLVQNSGHLLLKEELMKAVWPDSFVEEVNLSQNVSALRKALSDTAQESRYIATVPGKGYRFVAEVKKLRPQDEEAAEEADSLILEKQSQSQVVIEQAKPWPVRTVIAGAMALLLAIVFGGYRLRKAGRSTEAATAIHLRRSVAVLGFQNLSGRSDPAWLATAFSEMMTTELAAGEQLRLVSAEEVALLRTAVPIPSTGTLSKSTLAQVHKAIGADFVVLGSYSDLGKESGGKIRVDVRLQDTMTGETIANISETGTETNLFQLVSNAGTDLRSRLGIPRVAEADAAAVQASLPTNPAAARLYSDGLAKLRVFDAVAARDLLSQAIQADRQYALAHSALSEAWSILGYDQKATDEAKKAFEFSDHLARRDRLFIEARYRVMNKEWEKALELYHTLFNFFPDDIEYGLRLADAQTQANKKTEALATIQAMRQLPAPAGADLRIDLAEERNLYLGGQYKAAEQPAARALDKAKAHDMPLLLARTLRTEGDVLSLTGQAEKAIATAEQARNLYAAAGDQFGVAATLDTIATALWFQGRYEECERAIKQGLAINRSIGNKGGAAGELQHLASIRGARGDLEGARKTYEDALAIARETLNLHGEAQALFGIAWTKQNEGDLAASLDLYEQASAIFYDLSDETAVANTLAHEAEALVEMGYLRKAKDRYQKALDQFQKNGNQNLIGLTLDGLGVIAEYQGKLDEAGQGYAKALSVGQAIGDGAVIERAELGLADVAYEEGRLTEARRQVDELVDYLGNHKDPVVEVEVRSLLAEIFLKQGNIVEAGKTIESVREFLRQNRLPYNHPYTLTAARIQGARGQLSEARKALSRAIADEGDVNYKFEARLALCQIDASTDPAAARGEAQRLAREAATKGFGLIARKALALNR